MKDRPRLNFITYIFMMYQSGLIALGKIENPISKKTAIELEEATGIIELLEILEEKTKGNLNGEEEKTLNMVLDTLRMNYVEQSKIGQKEESKKDKNNGEDLEIH
jgi:hypothetical protein